MIVRILSEGQYDVSDDALARLNDLDSALEAAVSADDATAFGGALAALLDGVRTVGVPRAADSLDPSDVILPPSDATIDDVRGLLAADGLIPG
ncbi:MAG: PspA-associated protein PspAA [Nocardioides sp.]